jgi:hypothetical protein
MLKERGEMIVIKRDRDRLRKVERDWYREKNGKRSRDRHTKRRREVYRVWDRERKRERERGER